MMAIADQIRHSAKQACASDWGLLVVRVGLGLSFALLFGLKQSKASEVFAYQPGRVWPLILLGVTGALVVCGFWTEVAAAISALSWTWALYSGLRTGLAWYELPIRAALYAIMFAALAVSGAGRFSLDHALRGKSTKVALQMDQN